MTTILQFHPDGVDLLQCPTCGGDTTHLNTIEITNAVGQVLRVTAGGEDEDATIETVASVRPAVAGQRRHTITVLGECEFCDGFRLELMQHKGHTIVSGPFPAGGRP